MSATNLTIVLFLFGCAVPIALEAIKMNGRIRIGLWTAAAMFMLVGALWTPVSGAFPKVSAFAGGVAGNPVSWFMLLFAVAAIAREWWSRRRNHPFLPDDALGAEAFEGMEYLSRETSALRKDHVSLADQTATSSAALDQLKVMFHDVRGDLVTVSTQARETHELAAALRDQCSLHDGKIDAHHDEIVALRNTVDRLNTRIRALGNRETLIEVTERIRELEGRLYFPEGEGIEQVDWHQWQAVEKDWRAAVRAWASVANLYVQKDTWAIVSAVPPEDYLGSWSFAESAMPDTDTTHRYKTFCIMRRRFQGVEFEAKETLHRAAFG